MSIFHISLLLVSPSVKTLCVCVFVARVPPSGRLIHSHHQKDGLVMSATDLEKMVLKWNWRLHLNEVPFYIFDADQTCTGLPQLPSHV